MCPLPLAIVCELVLLSNGVLISCSAHHYALTLSALDGQQLVEWSVVELTTYCEAVSTEMKGQKSGGQVGS